MPTEIPINLDPDTIAILHKYNLVNKEGVMEALTRGKNKQYDTFFKLQLSSTKSETARQLEQIAASFSSHQAQNLQLLNSISKLSQFTMILSGLNLFATAAGFKLMNDKLKIMNSKIEEVIKRQKDAVEIDANFRIGNVIERHGIMLDHRRTQKYFSEDQMEDLVANEYVALNNIKKIFDLEAADNKNEVVFYMLSLAQMLAASLKYYDELYYFGNKEKLYNDDVWHSRHDQWTAALDSMIDTDCIEKIQDHGYFDLKLNTVENDCYYKSFRNKIIGLKQEIEDNQVLLTALGDSELFASVRSSLGAGTRADLEEALENGGIDPKECERSIRAAIA